MISVLAAAIVSMTGMAAALTEYENHNLIYNYVNITNISSDKSVETYMLNTAFKPDAYLIGIIIYPDQSAKPGSDIAALYPNWKVHSGSRDIVSENAEKKGKRYEAGTYDAAEFGYVRKNGNDNIPLDGSENIAIGRAGFSAGKPRSYGFLIHIYDPVECSRPENNGNSYIEYDTCLRRPGIINKALSLTMSAYPASYNAAGQVITYKYEIINSGNVILPGPFTVTDSKLGMIKCGEGQLDVGAKTDCAASYTIVQNDVSAGSITNTAFASGGYANSNRGGAAVTYMQMAIPEFPVIIIPIAVILMIIFIIHKGKYL